MAISDKLQDLIDIKQDIKVAIENKGVDLTGVALGGYAGKIDLLPLPKEEQTKIVSPTTSSQDVLPDTNKVLSKVTVNAIPTETKSQQPNLSSNNQTINATSGKFMTSFTITKDTTNHIASNIRNGKTLYGVTGNLQPAKVEQEKTVSNPNFSAGDVVVTPDANKVLSKATVKKDANLVAGNIKDGVTLFGVTGDYEGEGGGLVENRIVEFTNTNLVVIALSIWCDGGGAGKGYLSVLGSMSSNGANPTTLRSMTSWSDVGWKYFYIFVDKSQHRYIQIGAPDYKSYYIKLTRYNLGIKETYTAYSWIDLNDVKGMLCEFQADN